MKWVASDGDETSIPAEYTNHGALSSSAKRHTATSVALRTWALPSQKTMIKIQLTTYRHHWFKPVEAAAKKRSTGVRGFSEGC